jgi:tetratricopeptide (TPR) repeat protein
MLSLSELGGRVTGLAWSIDGKRLAAASGDGIIRIWDASIGYQFADSDERWLDLAWRLQDRAAIYSRAGQFAEALDDLSRAIELDPNSADHRIQRADVACRTGQWSQGIADYDVAIRLDPTSGEAYFGRARAYSMQGEFDKVLADLDTSLRLSPDHPLVLNNLSWLLATCPDHRFRDADRAIELANKALKIMPLAATTWNTLGVAQYRAGKWREAINSLTKSQELAPGEYTVENGFFLAMANWQLGDVEKALEHYEQAIQQAETTTSDVAELRRFRDEAAELLGIPNPGSVRPDGNVSNERTTSDQSGTARPARADGPLDEDDLPVPER